MSNIIIPGGTEPPFTKGHLKRMSTPVDFGPFWNHHLASAIQESAKWYAFPESMRRQMLGYKPTAAHARPLDKKQFHSVLAAVKVYATSSVAAYKLPYHNQTHFAEFAAAIVKIFDDYLGASARKEHLAVRQALEFVAWLHDCHHTGCTLRKDSINPLLMPELGTDVSTEYVSALAADDLLAGLELPLPLRVLVMVCVWGTTFAGDIAAKRGILNVPAIGNPYTPYFGFVRAADVFTPENIVTTVKKSIAVNVFELPATGRLTTAEEVVASQIGFEQYRINLFNHVIRTAKRPMPSLRQARERSLMFGAAFQEAQHGQRPGLMSLIANSLP